MNRSISDRHLGESSFSRVPSKRTIYVNKETSRREVSTPFHSPYKDGRRNPQYFNPSLVSSHLFYPKEAVRPDNPAFAVTHNIIPNPNDIKKEALYRQRMHTEMESRSKARERYKARELVRQEIDQCRILRLNQPSALLQTELDGLQKYRRNLDLKQQREGDMSRRRHFEQEEPIYLQKASRANHPRTVSPLKQGSQEGAARQLERLRRQLKQSEQNLQEYNLDRLVTHNPQLQISQEQEQQQRRQRQLLSSILKEQIRTNNAARERRWNN